MNIYQGYTMCSLRRFVCVCLCLCGNLLFTPSLAAAENAALVKHGATIAVTCKNKGRMLNEKWAKPQDMLKEKKAKGPIINDLVSGVITVTLPVALTVQQVSVRASDYKGGFATPKGITIRAEGYPDATFIMEQTDELQTFAFAAQTQRVSIHITSIYKQRREKKKPVRHGSISHVTVMVAENLSEKFSIPASYIAQQKQFIMVTDNLNPQKRKPVIGKPYKVTTHPKTIWSQRDIDGFKKAIQTSPKAQEAYAGTCAFAESFIAQAYQVPDKPDMGNTPKLAKKHTEIATGLGNLGIAYALSGNERYAQEARRLLLELADRYEGYPVHQSPSMKHDKSKWSWQRLNDAIWLIPAAWGYDLIHNSSSLSDADREKIEQHFIMPCVENIMSSEAIIGAPTNWSVICCAAVMIGARVCDNEEFYQKAHLGIKGDKKSGLYLHLDKGIDDDGLWAEGAMGYQLMALRGLLVMAEILWHDDIDVYSYDDNRLKFVFDSPIWYAYPGGRASPAVHDSGSVSLFGRDAHLYQYGYRRYGDPIYHAITQKITPTFESIFNLFLPACDFTDVDAASIPASPSILFPGVGFAINRTGFGTESKYLFMDYGPNRSHGHDDKLNFNIFALGTELFGDAGSAWYTTDAYRRYYPYSQAHNTLSANEQSQIRSDGRLELYGTAGDMALIRGTSDKAIPAAAMDRTLFMNDGRVYDTFWYAGGIPFTLDLIYHGHGTLEENVTTKKWDACPKEKNGYAYFKDPRIGDVTGDWTAQWQVKKGTVHAHFIGAGNTQVVRTSTPQSSEDLPTIMLRRHGTETVFAAVLDIVPTDGAASIASITTESNASAYCTTVHLVDGGVEHALINYTDTPLSLGDWSFDGRFAFVHMYDGVVTRLYMAGGTRLHYKDLLVTSATPSLIAYQCVSDSIAQLWNQSQHQTDVHISNVQSYDRTYLAEKQATSPTTPISQSITIHCPAESDIEFHKGTQQPAQVLISQRMHDKRKELLMIEEAERTRLRERSDAQIAAAHAQPLPADAHIIIQAEDFSSQAGGKLKVNKKKAAIMGAAFSGWNDRNHSIDYTFEVAHSGHYVLSFKYCREGDTQVRSVQIDDTFPGDYARAMKFPSTGGWSNGSDNWKLLSLTWGVLDKPYLIHLEAGTHTMRLDNTSGSGINLDYIVLTAPDFEISKKNIEAR